MRSLRLAVRFVPLLAIALLAVTGATPVHGAEFTVDTTADGVDTVTGDGNCATSGGDCTLRAAIMESNELDGPDTITVPDGRYELSIAEPLGGSGPVDTDAFDDIDITQDLTINGAGIDVTTVDANGIDRAFEVRPATQGTPVTININGLTITGGDTTPSRDGGGLKVEGVLTSVNVRLTDVRVTENVAQDGGGIAVADQATLTLVSGVRVDANDALVDGGGLSVNSDSVIEITDSEFTHNEADSAGAIMNVDTGGGTVNLQRVLIKNNNADTYGGGIFNGAAMTIRNTTIDENTATDNGGGGIYSASDLTLTIQNSTISNNFAGGIGEGGGGLQQDAEGPINITNSTIARNESLTIGGGMLVQGEGPVTLNAVTVADSIGNGGIYFRGDATFHVQNTIFVDNSCVVEGGSNVDSTDAGRNMSSDPSCQSLGFSHTATLTVLGLGNNGGPTQTMALPEGSPALDIGEGCTSTDQRGVARPGEGCDIGAYELTSLQKWGDILCDGEVDPRDALQLALAQAEAALLDSSGDCPIPDEKVEVDGTARSWGDPNCDGESNGEDLLAILSFAAHLAEPASPSTCPDIGDEVTVEVVGT